MKEYSFNSVMDAHEKQDEINKENLYVLKELEKWIETSDSLPACREFFKQRIEDLRNEYRRTHTIE